MTPDGNAATILAMLREGPRQAQDLAEAIGIDTSAARRHLERLRAQGLVDARDVVDGPGRPKKMYHATAAGLETFPRNYALVLNLVLAKLGEVRGRAEVERVLRAAAADLGAEAATAATVEARTAALLKLYNDLGFDATVQRPRGGLRLVQRNCILLRTAAENPHLICECFDEGIVRAVFPEATVTLEASLAQGDARCRHHIALPKTARA